MSTNAKTIFTTGEFAALCGVKKDTLFYYDRIGLFRPAIVKENGYRCYTLEQYFVFAVIVRLRELDTPLEEIHRYLTNRTPENFQRILLESREKLEEKRKKLEWLLRQMDNTLVTVREGMETVCGTVRLMERETEYLLVTPIVPADSPGPDVFLRCAQDHLFYCREHLLGDELMLGSIGDPEAFQKGELRETCYFSKLSGRPAVCDRMHVKPAGRYAVIDQMGSYDDARNAFTALLAFLREKALRPIGVLYDYDLLNYLALEKQDDYVVRFEIAVEQERRDPAENQ